jgi:hypothetical protein
MKSLAVKIAIAFVFNAITLWVASVLPGVRLGTGFLWAVVVFTAATLLVKPFVAGFLRRRLGNGHSLSEQERRTWLMAKASTLGASLMATLIVLILTSLFSQGFAITNLIGWVAATIVIWLASLIYDFVDDGLEARAHQLLGSRANPGKP